MRSNGYTLIESILVIALISILIAAGASSVAGLVPKYHLQKAVWEVRSRLTQARIRSIWEGIPIRVRFGSADYAFEIYDEKSGAWVVRSSGAIEGARIEANNAPIFHPTGTVSNLATVRIFNSRGAYKVTLAISGRIKVAGS
jgi:prepilin-type N-terminal cleavage/methylation domain-containing protein